MIPLLDRVARAATLVLPVFLIHGRGIADGLISLVAILFLIRSAKLRDAAWLRAWWLRIALAWWAWLVLCSIPLGTALQAALILRFLVFTAALEHWILRDAWMRGWIARLIRYAFFYMAAQAALQFATGRNLFGNGRGLDGELTGPFDKPRMGPILARILYPAVLPLSTTPLRAVLYLAGGILLMMLTGQRMPLLLSFLGLFITAMFMRRLRAPVLYTAVAAGILLAALPRISPDAAHRIETKFAAQLEHFRRDEYGFVAEKGLAMFDSDPWTGVGFDGFRHLCEARQFADAGEFGVCVQHPHSFYLQAAVEAGIPGLILFSAMAVAWLVAIGRGLWRNPDPLRVGLFAGACIQLWPIAASTDWVAMPLSGWFYLQLGLALALARPYMPGQQTLT